MISRPTYTDEVRRGLQRSPVVALLGPRQCGKSTLAKSLALEVQVSWYFDLENPEDQARLAEPQLLLSPLKGLIILDEIQLRPDLFPLLRVLADRPGQPAKFLLLGSASPLLIRMSAESLAGRIAFVEIQGFNLGELPTEQLRELWLRGGFPRSYLAADLQESWAWRQDFIRTFLERDIPQLGIKIAAAGMRRFWTMLSHYHGQSWNASEMSASLGLSDKTLRGYLDLLCGTFMVRQLLPWHENLGKRQVKAPKIYLRDSGLAHSLLGIADDMALAAHPKLGASWEGFVIEQILAQLQPEEAYFWRTNNGAELDLLCFKQGQRLGFEFKYTDRPQISRSMHIAKVDLKLNRLIVVHAGQHAFPLSAEIDSWPAAELSARLHSLL